MFVHLAYRLAMTAGQIKAPLNNLDSIQLTSMYNVSCAKQFANNLLTNVDELTSVLTLAVS